MNTQLASMQWISIRRRPLAIPVASVLTIVTWLAFIGSDARLWHWFVIPTLLSGLLIGSDAARWFSGEYALFDPKGIVGAFGWSFFFLTPLVFIHANAGLPYGEPPADWRPWVGYLSTINVVSLVLYQVFHGIGFRWRRGTKSITWVVATERVHTLFLLFAGIALLAEGYYFMQSGGISGMIARTATIRETGKVSYENGGLGLFAIAGQALPMLVLIFLTLKRQKTDTKQASLFQVIVLLSALVVAQFFFGGLENSRSATVNFLLWFAGIVHHFWRPFTKRNVLVGLVIISVFLYLYGFYKNLGTDAFQQLADGASFGQLEAQSGRSVESLFLGDLSRTNIQSYEIYRLQNTPDYRYRWGSTYISALLRPIPSWLWPSRPIDPEKVVAGTELIIGPYKPGDRFWNAAYVYGMAGEAMLNYGVFFAPLPFAIWGFSMGYYRRALLSWREADMRHFLAPYLMLTFFGLPGGDLDNLVTGFVGKCSFVLLFLLLISRHIKERVP